MKKIVWSLVLLLSLTLLAGTAMAHRNGGGMMGSYDDWDGYGYCDRYAVDRKEIKAVTDKYADQFEALDKRIAAKRDELHQARSNDATTVGQLNKLRTDMLSIKSDYRELRGKVDEELTEKFGAPDDEHFGRHRGRHHRGEGMGMMRYHDDDDYGWGRGHGGCRW